MFPIKGMEKLKVLRCYYSDLAPEDGAAAFDPGALLPASLEHVHLDGVESEEKKLGMLDAFLQAKKGSLPNLTQVCLPALGDSPEAVMRLKARAAEHGLGYEPIDRTEDVYRGREEKPEVQMFVCGNGLREMWEREMLERGMSEGEMLESEMLEREMLERAEAQG